MSVQVRRRREAASFLSTYVGAQGELLVDTTNNRVQVHDGATPGGWPAAKLADVIGRTAVADAAYAAKVTDRMIAVTALTASRTITLPASSAYPTGTTLTIVDESGAASTANTIVATPAGTDTINGTTSFPVSTAYGYAAFESNGTGKWTVIDQAVTAAAGGSGGVAAAQLVGRNALINGNFAINQRGYASGTALAANAYAHDRWKAGANGCTYTFGQAVPDTQITITAGSLIQAVDAPNVYATTFWLTWTGTATARVWQGSASGSFAAGTPTSVGGVTVNTLAVSGMTAGTITNVEFTNGTLGLVQLEAALPNLGPTRFERRHIGTELLLCQRYFQTVLANIRIYATIAQQNCETATYFTPMRAAPTCTFIQNYGGRSNGVYNMYSNTNVPGAVDACCRFVMQTSSAGDAYALFDLWSLSAEL